MKTYTRDELNEILAKHSQWLSGIDGGVRADLSYVDLRGVDLRGIDLRGANLWGANLWGVDLRGANLRDANLRDANLRDANLWGANLRGADLQGANLWGANLRDAIGNLKHIKSLQCEKYCVTYTANVLQIGCQSHTIEEWKNFSDETISKMDIGALDWWIKWKPIILHIIEISPAEPTGVTK